MPAWLIPAAITAASALMKPKGRKYDWKAAKRINDRYLGMRPEGYLTPQDEALAERTRAKGVASARRGGQLAREGAQHMRRQDRGIACWFVEPRQYVADETAGGVEIQDPFVVA